MYRLLTTIVALGVAAGWGSASAQRMPDSRPSISASGYRADPAWRGWGTAHAYPVREAGPVVVTPLPAPPAEVGSASDDPIEDALAQDPVSYGAILPGLPLPGAASTDDVHDGGFSPPYIPDRYTWDYIHTSTWPSGGVSSASPGLRGAPDLRQVGLGHAVSNLPWSVGASSWVFKGDIGPRISVGSQEVGKPDWARNAKLAGINVADTNASGNPSEDTWNYSFALGAIDNTPTATDGDLAYGSGAGYASLSYGLSPALTLESQVELAPSLVSTGLGGEIQTDWGAWRAGVARASGSLYKGWRYQAAYTVDLLENIQLTWLNEASTEGFTDLSTYDTGPSRGANRQKWSATIPTSGRGDLSGSYESLRPSSGDPRHSFGLTQQFWYSPNLQIGLSAKRETVTGDYDVGIRFSVPVF